MVPSTEPLAKLATERCQCGKEYASPADWQLVFDTAKSYGPFFIKDREGTYWNHLPKRLGGCTARDHYGDFVPGERPAVSPTPEESKPMSEVSRPVQNQSPSPAPSPSSPSKGNDKGLTLKEFRVAASLNPAISNGAMLMCLRRYNIPLEHIDAPGTARGHLLVIPSAHLDAAARHCREIRPRLSRRAGAVGVKARKIKNLVKRKYITKEEGAIAMQQLMERVPRPVGRPRKDAAPEPPEEITAPAPHRPAIRPATKKVDGNEFVDWLRRILERANIIELHWQNGRLTARKSVTVEESFEA